MTPRTLLFAALKSRLQPRFWRLKLGSLSCCQGPQNVQQRPCMKHCLSRYFPPLVVSFHNILWLNKACLFYFVLLMYCHWLPVGKVFTHHICSNMSSNGLEQSRWGAEQVVHWADVGSLRSRLHFSLQSFGFINLTKLYFDILLIHSLQQKRLIMDI